MANLDGVEGQREVYGVERGRDDAFELGVKNI
jgi:hypothetical protein